MNSFSLSFENSYIIHKNITLTSMKSNISEFLQTTWFEIPWLLPDLCWLMIKTQDFYVLIKDIWMRNSTKSVKYFTELMVTPTDLYQISRLKWKICNQEIPMKSMKTLRNIIFFYHTKWRKDLPLWKHYIRNQEKHSLTASKWKSPLQVQTNFVPA